MILDLARFTNSERPLWSELERILNKLEAEPDWAMTLDEARRFHYLFERATADLARIATFSSDPETCRYLENLVARAYGDIHETRENRRRLRPLKWFFQVLPQTFRRRIGAFWLAVAVTVVGVAFGGLALALDPESKPILLPFAHLQGDPAKRVAEEEGAKEDRLQGRKTAFSTMLMTHNTKVSILSMALGMTWGVGTVVLLFYNGVVLGAVSVDYVLAGQTKFLLGWLLPHGAIEIPAILIASQAGLVLAAALIGRGRREPLASRIRSVGTDLITLIFGAGLLLIWAGFVEAFLSQYHEPIIPYSFKIVLGIVEVILLFFFLSQCGTRVAPPDDPLSPNEPPAIS